MLLIAELTVLVLVDVDVDVDEELGVGVIGGVLPTQAVSASGASKRPKNLYMGISP